MYSFMAASAHAGMKKTTENKTFTTSSCSQCSVDTTELGENIMGTTKDTAGDNDDHFYVVPSEKIKFIRISCLLCFSLLFTPIIRA